MSTITERVSSRGRCIKGQQLKSNSSTKCQKKLNYSVEQNRGTPCLLSYLNVSIHQLSVDLNNVTDNMVPELNSVQVTHLLWADDQVLLALDYNSLQSMLDVLFEYCNDWGLTVNTSKTAIMVFNQAGRQLKESNTLKLGNTVIPSTREYCYLGVKF